MTAPSLLDLGPDDLRAALGDEAADRNGVPRPGAADRMARARAAVDAVVGPADVAASPLGDGWSSDLDLYLTSRPDERRLLAAGWVPLDGILSAVGSRGQGRWAVVDGGEVVGRVDLQLGPAPDPVARVLARCRRRGEVRLREVLELRELAPRGATFPATDRALAAAADAERGLGGDRLARWATGAERPLPVALGGARRRLGLARRRLRPRLVVAFSGVDGSGKSSLARRLAGDLAGAGVPVATVWARPGMGLGWLSSAAVAAKRLLGQAPEPGVRAVAAGRGDRVASRRGPLGWAWSVAVTVAFVAGVLRRHAAAAGVVVYDRHLLDALVTLDFVYGGVPLGLQRAVVRRLLPEAAVTFYLDVPAEVAVARKPGDTFGEHAVRRQLDGYAARRAEVPGAVVLDGTRPPDDLARDVLTRLTERMAGSVGGRDGRRRGAARRR